METPAAIAHTEPHAGGERHLPLWVTLGVFGALIVLTLITVVASQIDLGPLNVWIALGIATVKAILVGLFFMHLIFERPMNLVVLFTSLIFVFLFIGFVILDTASYKPDMIPDYAPDMRR